MYLGQYHGSKKHEPDVSEVLHRSWKNGLEKIMITGGSLEESKRAIEMAKSDGMQDFSLPALLKVAAD